MYHGTYVKVRGQHGGVDSLLPSCMSWVSNPGHQTSSVEQSRWLLLFLLLPPLPHLLTLFHSS